MSDFRKCTICREWGWFYGKLGDHVCKPLWEARLLETKWENGWEEARGRDAEEAASKFCERYDQDGEYSIIQNGSAEVEVRKFGEAEITIVDVSAESVPTYYARTRSPQEGAGERHE